MRKLMMMCVAAALVAIYAVSAWAGAQSPFTKAEMLKCIADAPAFIQYMQEQGDKMENVQDPSDYEAILAHKAADSYLKDHGWSPERFSYVFTNLSEGYAAEKMRPQMAALKAQQAQMAQMANMPGMTPEMMAEMQSSMQEAQDIGKDVPASEMELIKANMPAIENMINSMR